MEVDEVKVTVTLVLNASFIWPSPSNTNTIPMVGFIVLCLLALCSICINTCMLVTITCSSNLKKVSLNQLLFLISISSLLDSCVNIPFALYFMKTKDFAIGVHTCRTNAVFVLLVSAVTTWCICGLCVERWLSIYRRGRLKLPSSCKRPLCISTGIVVIILITLPITLGIEEVYVLPNWLTCFTTFEKSRQYTTVIFLCLVVPLSLSVALLLTAVIRNFRNIRNISSQRVDLSYAELFFEESHLWNEWQNSKFVCLIVILYIIFELPFIIKHTQLVSVYPKTQTSHSQNSTRLENLPGIKLTSSIDLLYPWSKFVFCFLFSLLSFIVRKDIRRKLCAMASCYNRKNALSNNSRRNKSETKQQECPDDFLVPRAWRRRRLSSVTDLTTPIIFGRQQTEKFQFLDITAGIARWKASYDISEESLSKQRNKGCAFFDDVFEDEDEFTEFERYEDATEEEINSSEKPSPSTSREVAVQTVDKTFTNPFVVQYSGAISSSLPAMNNGNIRKYKANRRNSKSFVIKRASAAVVRQRNYSTYPKMPANSRSLCNLQGITTTSNLLNALKAYRSQKYLTTCEVLPTGTDELLGGTIEGGDIVSL